MKRIILSTLLPLAVLLLAVLPLAGSSAVSAQDEHYTHIDSIAIAEQATECDICTDPWARFHGFLFRRYAGSVEMESKTPYPKSYFGRFTYLPWKPDWVNTPANRVRESQYRHHLRGRELPKYAPEFTPMPNVLPPEAVYSTPGTVVPEISSPRFDGLHEVEVMPAE